MKWLLQNLGPLFRSKWICSGAHVVKDHVPVSPHVFVIDVD